MNKEQLLRELEQAQSTIQALQEKLAVNQAEGMNLAEALQKKLEERSAILRETQEELQQTNSELLQLTLELEDRVIERTQELEEKEKTLQETNQVLAAIIQASPLSIDAVDRDGRVLLWSPASERMFGWKAEEVIGKTLPIVPEWLLEDFRQQTNEGLQGQVRTGKEIQRQRKDGSLVDVTISTAPFTNAQGQVSGVMAILEDVTERKRIEAELVEVQHRLMTSMETERRELAQDIHDGPIQDLYSISYSLKGMGLPGLESPDQNAVDDVYANLQSSIDKLREICGELRPPTLAHFGLGKAIQSHAQRYQEQHPEIQVQVDLNGADEVLPEALNLGLFRIYQQALANVTRHAEAKHLHIRLSRESDRIVLEIQDDGKGFDVPSRWIEIVREGHLGLVGATERAEALGGHLEIFASPGKGTRLCTIVPYR